MDKALHFQAEELTKNLKNRNIYYKKMDKGYQ